MSFSLLWFVLFMQPSRKGLLVEVTWVCVKIGNALLVLVEGNRLEGLNAFHAQPVASKRFWPDLGRHTPSV